MITENELKRAIAQYQGLKDPNANDCIRLASYYTILDHTEEQQDEKQNYSFSVNPSNVKLKQALERKSVDEIILLIDELLEALEVLNPRLYSSFINKL